MSTQRDTFRKIAKFEKNTNPFHFEAMGFWRKTIEGWHKESLPKDKTPWEYFDMYQIMDNTPDSIKYLVDKVVFPAYYPLFENKVLERKEDYFICIEEDGILKKQKNDKSSFPQFLKFPVETRDDWKKIKERLNPDIEERYKEAKDEARKIKGHDYILRFGICGCYGFLRNLFGEEKLAYVYYDDPDLLHEMMRQWLKLYVGIADKLCPLIDFDYVFMWEDMAYKTAPLISPDLFREFMLPYYKNFTSHMKKKS